MKKKKLKRYRLKINPEKGSTVDFISQVESPAIEVGFLKFNTQKLNAEGNMDVFGYNTQHFEMCPGAQATFSDLIMKGAGEELVGMIRSAAQIADNVFRIEKEVIQNEMATSEQMNEAMLLVSDFKDVIDEIAEDLGETINVDYMDGHIEVISEYLGEALADFVDACWEGYEPVGFKIKDGQRVPNCVPIKEEMQSYSDYPEAAKDNAARGIRLNEEIGNKCATQIGKVRAQQIANGEAISKETITRTFSYLSRAKAYYDANDTKACGTISYLLWGGDEMLRWTESKMNADDFIKAKMQAESNDEKMELFGPVLIPDMPIYRNSETMGEYEIIFKKEDIKEIAMNFMKSGYQKNVNLDHSENMADSYVFESFVSDELVQNPKPYENLPLGTWFVRMKVQDEKVWQDIKAGKRNGFSIEGIFEYMVEEFEKSYKPQNRPTNKLSENEKLNLEKMIKDLFRKIFTELSQELGEKAEDLGEWQKVASSNYKVEAREVGQKVEIVDAEGNLMPAPDGAYEFEDGFKFMVKDGVISQVDGSVQEEPMQNEEAEVEVEAKKGYKKSYMDMLADYPWEQCVADMAEEGYTEEQANAICGSIRWKNMESQEQMKKHEENTKQIDELKVQFEELKASSLSKDEVIVELNKVKDEFIQVFEKFTKVPAEPSRVVKNNLAKDLEKKKFEQFIETIRKVKK